MNHDGITEKIIGCTVTVSNALGAGRNTLVHEVRKTGLRADQQHPIQILHDGIVVGEFAVDILGS